MNEENKTKGQENSEKAIPENKRIDIGAVFVIVLGILAVVVSAVVILGGINFNGLVSNDGSEDGGESAGGETDDEVQDFIDNIGGVSETFEGTVSTESYSSAKNAAEAFVVKEVAGEDGATIMSSESKGELSKSEIEALKLPDEYKDCDLVEKLEVTYKVKTDTASAYSAKQTISSTTSEKKVTVYVIKVGVDWKYFSPLPVTGDTINKSYYESVFNSEKYKNCTLKQTSDIIMNITGTDNGEPVSIKMTMKTDSIYKYADNKIYMEGKTTIKGEVSSDDIEDYSETQVICLYAEQIDGEYICYVKLGENSEWLEGNMNTVGFTDIEELSPFYDQYLDYTYFTKTNYGFELSEENGKKYFEQAYDYIFDQLGMDLPFNMEIKPNGMVAQYYVQDGALTGMKSSADVSFSMSMGQDTANFNEKVDSVTTCYDYGTTTVDRPAVD